MECSCRSSEFCYGPAGHVVTGDLRIIKDAKLRELVIKGLPIESRIILIGV